MMATNASFQPAPDVSATTSATVDVNRALAEAAQLLSSPTPAATQNAPNNGVRLFASLPTGGFGEPAQVIPLNRRVRLQSQPGTGSQDGNTNTVAPQQHAASLAFGNLQLGGDTALPPQSTSSFATTPQDGQQYGFPPNQMPGNGVGGSMAMPMQSQISSATMQPFSASTTQYPSQNMTGHAQHSNYGAPSFLQGQMQQQQQQSFPSQDATLGAPPTTPPPTSATPSRSVRFFDGNYVSDTDTSPVDHITPPHNDGESLHMSILKNRNALDTPKLEPIDDNDDEDEEDMEWEPMDNDDFEDLSASPIIAEDDDEEQDEQKDDTLNPILSMRFFDKDNPPRLAERSQEEQREENVQESFLDRYNRELGKAQTDSANDTNIIADDFRLPGQMPTLRNQQSLLTDQTLSVGPSRVQQERDFSAIDSGHKFEVAQRARAKTIEDANNVGILKRGFNYMKGVDSQTGMVDKSARNKRIIIASILLVLIIAAIGGLIYMKFYRPRRRERKDHNKVVAKESPAVGASSQPAHATKGAAGPSTPNNEVVPAKRQETLATPPKTDKAQKAPAVNFDILANEAARDISELSTDHVVDFGVPTTAGAAVVNPEPPLLAINHFDVANLLDTDNAIL